MVYLSKKLDPVAAGWPPCLCNVAAAALLFKDADKLTMGKNITVATPHAIEGVLKQPPDKWLSNACMTHYQTLLINPGRVTFQPPASLNPTALLPYLDLDQLLHQYSEILAHACSTRPDLKDLPLTGAEQAWFMDGSSFI